MISDADFPPGPSIATAFLAMVERHPGRLAITVGAQSVTYAELGARVATLAQALRAAGVQRGDRVLVHLDNGIDFAVAAHAVPAMGAVLVPVSPLTRAAKLQFLLEDTEAVAVLTHAALAPAWGGALRGCPGLRCVLVAGLSTDAVGDASGMQPWPAADSRATCTPCAVSGADLAALIYTSGTTGRPKGVMLGHANMRAAWRAVQAYLQLREDDVVGLALPMCFSYGLYHAYMTLGLGARLVIERAAAFPAALVRCLAAERVTVFPGVPTLFSSVLAQDTSKHDLAALRILTNAAAALPPSHLARLRERFPQAAFFAMYGLTECKRASFLPPSELDARPGSVGRGIPFQQHWLVDAAGVVVPPGGSGELVVAGDHVMQGYWRQPAMSAEKLRPGPGGVPALYTGDLFRSDADGYLYFASRTDDIIKTRGEKVSPVEVEHLICGLQGVTDAAVVGEPDDLLGESVCAYVVRSADGTLTEREVIRHCMAGLESYMAPKRVVFVEALPLTDSGKVRRADLRALHEKHGPGN